MADSAGTGVDSPVRSHPRVVRQRVVAAAFVVIGWFAYRIVAGVDWSSVRAALGKFSIGVCPPPDEDPAP